MPAGYPCCPARRGAWRSGMTRPAQVSADAGAHRRETTAAVPGSPADRLVPVPGTGLPC